MIQPCPQIEAVVVVRKNSCGTNHAMKEGNETIDAAEGAEIKRISGFTLIELLAALVLLSLMFMLLMSGLQFAMKVWNEREVARSHTSQALAVQDMMRRLLSEARPVMVQVDKSPRQQVLFVGTKNSIRFVAPMLRHLGMGGLYEVTLYLAKADQSRNLEMSWRVFPQGSDEQRVVLLSDVADLEFVFFGAPRREEIGRWYRDWREQLVLPELIRVRLDPDRIDFVVAPMVQSMNLIIIEPDTTTEGVDTPPVQ
jgi:general secretion pathway protein J